MKGLPVMILAGAGLGGLFCRLGRFPDHAPWARGSTVGWGQVGLAFAVGLALVGG
jgi:hypothetical protein